MGKFRPCFQGLQRFEAKGRIGCSFISRAYRQGEGPDMGPFLLIEFDGMGVGFCRNEIAESGPGRG